MHFTVWSENTITAGTTTLINQDDGVTSCAKYEIGTNFVTFIVNKTANYSLTLNGTANKAWQNRLILVKNSSLEIEEGILRLNADGELICTDEETGFNLPLASDAEGDAAGSSTPAALNSKLGSPYTIQRALNKLLTVARSITAKWTFSSLNISGLTASKVIGLDGSNDVINYDFGTDSGDVAEGNHAHTFGTSAGEYAEGNHSHIENKTDGGYGGKLIKRATYGTLNLGTGTEAMVSLSAISTYDKVLAVQIRNNGVVAQTYNIELYDSITLMSQLATTIAGTINTKTYRHIPNDDTAIPIAGSPVLKIDAPSGNFFNGEVAYVVYYETFNGMMDYIQT